MEELDAVAVHLGIAAGDSDMSMIQALPLEDIQQLLAKHPNKAEAEVYRRQHGLAKSPTENWPLCKTSPKDLGGYSIGLELYLLFIKQMCWVFFIISLFCALPVYVNYNGGYYEVADALDLNAAFSIGNTEVSDETPDSYYLAVMTDGFYTLLFMLLLPSFLVYGLARMRRNSKASVQFSDYAIQVKGLPFTVTEAEIQKHFSVFGDIYQVALARKYNDLLFEYKTLAMLRHECDRCKAELQAKEHQEHNRKIDKLGNKINKLQMKLAAKKKTLQAFHELPVIRAYVVFKERRSKVECLRYFRKRTGCLTCNEDFKGVMYLDRHRLKVASAPEPSGIHFENLEVSKCTRRTRGLVSTVIILLLMALSVAMLYWVKTTDDDLPVCKEDQSFYSENLEEFETTYKAGSYTDDEQYCWCKNQDSEDLAVDEDLREFCTDYITKRTRSMLLKFGSAFGIVIVNLFLKFIIRKLISWERHANISREQRKIMTRMFWAMFINTGFIILMVNANFKDFEFQGGYLFNGKYSDFNREWYLKVGGLISIMAALAVVSPHGLLLLVRYPLGVIKRRCCWKRYKNQYDLNRAFLGRPFDIAGRSAQILMMISVFFMYSGGMPVLNMMIFVGLAFIYWSEKILLLREYATPPYFSMKMYISSLKLLYMAITMHCLFSLYMMGAPDIFPPEEPDAEEDHGIWYRVTTDAGIVYVGLILILSVMYIFAWLITKMCIWCLNKIHAQTIQENTVPLEEVIEDLRSRGLVTYELYDLEQYRRLIDEMNIAAAAEKTGALSSRSARYKEGDKLPGAIPLGHERLELRRSRKDINEDISPPKPQIRDENLSVSSSDFDKAESIRSVGGSSSSDSSS